MNRRRQRRMMRWCGSLTLLAILGVIPACNAVSGVSKIDFVTCAISFGAPKALAVVGGKGGGPFEDACPAGQALVGFQGGVISGGRAMAGLVAVCGAVSLSSSDPHAITSTLGISSPVRGTSDAVTEAVMCSVGQVVVGFGGKTFTDTATNGTFLAKLEVHCAPLVINGLPGAPAISLGPIEDLPTLGYAMDDLVDAFSALDCPAGQVALVSRGQSYTLVDAFGIACGAPVIDCGAAAEE
jgi:hypothetical protein